MAADTPYRVLKEKLRRERAQLIVRVAEEVIAEKGYHDTSMDEIAIRAGVAKGTLYQHFPSKEDLIFALLEQNLLLFEQTIQGIAASPLTARAKLEGILHYVYHERGGPHSRLLQLLHDNHDIFRGLFKHKVELHDLIGRCLAQLTTILEEGKAAGEFPSTLSTGLMLTIFMNLLSLGKSGRFFTQEQLSGEELMLQIGCIFFEGITLRQ